MSDWKKTLADAPKDKPILVRVPKWDCPCVMRYEVYDGEGYWGFQSPLNHPLSTRGFTRADRSDEHYAIFTHAPILANSIDR